jgi:hypothetical protein
MGPGDAIGAKPEGPPPPCTGIYVNGHVRCRTRKRANSRSMTAIVFTKGNALASRTGQGALPENGEHEQIGLQESSHDRQGKTRICRGTLHGRFCLVGACRLSGVRGCGVVWRRWWLWILFPGLAHSTALLWCCPRRRRAYALWKSEVNCRERQRRRSVIGRVLSHGV